MIKLEDLLALSNVKNLATLFKGYVDDRISALSSSVSDIFGDVQTSLEDLETTKAESVSTTGTGNAITSITKSGKEITAEKGATFSLYDHTHNYAGSSSAGGAADSANKLNTNAGSVTQPVYFAGGVPVKTTHTLGASVPEGAKFTELLSFSNVSVAVSAWASNTTYSEFPYRAAITCSGVTANHIADVNFAVNEAISGNFAPVCETAANVVYIYAKTKPTAAITIPTIEARKAVS